MQTRTSLIGAAILTTGALFGWLAASIGFDASMAVGQENPLIPMRTPDPYMPPK